MVEGSICALPMSLAATSATKYSLRPVFNMRKDDRIRLQHMLDAVNEALTFIQGKIRADLDKERMLVLSLIRELEIIGEAASKVSPETRSQTNKIPWQDITGMRNRLIHAYFDVDLDSVWSTVTKDLPVLKAELQKIL
jgi:uncharacterized protein with HEPN domain